MKKILNFIICWACIFVVFNAKAQVFYDVCSTGQLLKYSAISSDAVSVSAGGDCELSGDLVIPSVVVYNGISYSVTTIGGSAFEGCSGLTSLTIPNSVTTIPSYAFLGCSGLTSIVVEAGNPVYDSRNNCNAIIQTSINHLILGCQTTVIPNNVTVIGSYAFSGCSGLTSLTIPNSVTTIQDFAFEGCSGLTSLTIPNSVISIQNFAFEGCSGLTSLTIPNSVTTIQYGAFSGCSGLISLTIPNSVTTIGSHAFYECSGLTSIAVEAGNPVYDSRNNCNAIINTSYNELIAGCQTTTIPSTVTAIGSGAFWGCSGLSSLNIPNSVTTIGYAAFRGCSGLTSIVVEAGNPIYDSRNNCNAIIQKSNNHLILGCQTTVIPNNVTTIGQSAFDECSGLTSLIIPNSVTTIEWGAFIGCSGLTSLTIPNSVTTIQHDAFYGCSGLTSLNIPNSVTTIGYAAFAACSGLTSIVVEEGNPVYDSRDNCNAIIETSNNNLITGCQTTTIPNSVTTIGYAAFYKCSDLTSLTIPNSVTSIGSSAFYGCSGLTSITIPNSVTTIGGAAFYNCSGLTSITIPNSVTLIESEAFHKCVNLSSVRFEGITPPEFESAFYDVFPCIVDTIYVPEGCVENYSNAINNNSIVITDGHVGVDNHVASNPLIVYPNPTSNIVNVECEMGNGESGDVTIQLYDIYGKLVGVNVVWANDYSPIPQATAQIDLSRYANGVYFIKAVANGHVMGIRKVVKQ